MKIIKGKTRSPHKEGYQLTIDTMEGDADDFHSIDYDYNVDQIDELREMIIACEVLAKSYPKGGAGVHGYVGEYWDKVSDDWPYDSRCGCCDSYKGYSVIYHDGLGNISTCDIELDEEALEEIKNAPPQERSR